jgi:hypothetical protein
MDDKGHIKGLVVVVLTNVKTGEKRTYETKNIVTDAGDLYYAESGANEAQTNFTTAASEYGTAGNAVTKSVDRSNAITTKTSGSIIEIDATYPTTADPDGDNTGSGADIVSWRFSYGTGDGNDTTIDRLTITNWNAGTPGASEPLLMYALFGASFSKTASDTLKIFVNHTFTGV